MKINPTALVRCVFFHPKHLLLIFCNKTPNISKFYIYDSGSKKGKICWGRGGFNNKNAWKGGQHNKNIGNSSPKVFPCAPEVSDSSVFNIK